MMEKKKEEWRLRAIESCFEAPASAATALLLPDADRAGNRVVIITEHTPLRTART